MNLEAWRLMSDEDKSKVVDYYGWQLNDRREDFGVDGSEEVAQWVDEKQGWAALYERLTADWLKVDFPGYAERFHRDVRSDYFIEHFVPECMFAEPWTNEMQKMYEAELMCFRWACEAYEALERYNAYHRTAAVQVISGELIEIITDKVLVPRITPSSAIEVSGTIYGIIKEGVGAASDIFLSITEASDWLIETTIGKSADWDDAQKVGEKIDFLIEQNLALIKSSMDDVKALKAKIEADWQTESARRTTAMGAAADVGFELKPEVRTEIETVVNSRDSLSQLLALSDVDSDSASIVIGAIPGFYYSVETGAAPDLLAREDWPVMATGETVEIPVAAPSGNTGFFRIVVEPSAR